MTSDALNDFAKQETFTAAFFRVHALRWKRTHAHRLICLAAQPVTGHYQIVAISFPFHVHVKILKTTPSFNEAVMTFNKESGTPPLDPLDSY